MTKIAVKYQSNQISNIPVTVSNTSNFQSVYHLFGLVARVETKVFLFVFSRKLSLFATNYDEKLRK
jgi:hypothetical protein